MSNFEDRPASIHDFLRRASKLGLWLSIEDISYAFHITPKQVWGRLMHARRSGLEIERRGQHLMHEYRMRGAGNEKP